MLKLMSLRKDKQAGEASKKKPSKTAVELRVQKDVSELELPATVKVHFGDENDLLHFTLTIEPDEGMYKGGHFVFTVEIGSQYPYSPPKVKCTQIIYHPNIDLEGHVCLNILREDWKPVLNLNSVVIGMQYLFLEPNPDDPLNKEAANALRKNPKEFAADVVKTMYGGLFNGAQYDNVITPPPESA